MDGGVSLILFTALSAASSLVQGIGAYQQGREAQKSAERQSESVLRAARYNDWLRQQRMKRLIARNLAEAGMGGSLSRSDLAVIADNAVLSELAGDIDLYNARVQAMQIRTQGRQIAMQGKTALFGGLLGAGAAIADYSTLRKEYDYYTKPGNKFSDVRVDRGKTPGIPFF